MTALHWIARHYVLAYLLASALFTIGWCVFLVWFGESDEAREHRRRNERIAQAQKHLRESITLYVDREGKKRVNEILSQITAEDEARHVSDGEAQAEDSLEGAA